MKRFFMFISPLLFTLACDMEVQAPIPRNGETKCQVCEDEQAELLMKQKQEYMEFDCSLGTMLACLDQGILTHVECEELVMLQGGQLDTYMKLLQLQDEAKAACVDVCL